MHVSPTTNGSFSRPVNHTQNSNDRQSNEENQTTILERKTQERAVEQRAVQEKTQYQKEESQRRLDGRLINFGYEENSKPTSQSDSTFNQSRVNEAYYSPPPSNNVSQQQYAQNSDESERDAIDIVV